MRLHASLNAMIGLLLLSGCAAMDGRSGGQGPTPEEPGRIRPGVTTTGEVKALLGPPIRATRFDRMERDVWEYRRYNDPMDEHHIAVQFSPDGIVREVLVIHRELHADEMRAARPEKPKKKPPDRPVA